ncbi:MAG TPA: NPCBM/NEW2 domain-containing protein [Fimbriimonas sp.]|nr:NPCBM/NEW2 domain-containing protein [Fimbriimonas sp.]
MFSVAAWVTASLTAATQSGNWFGLDQLDLTKIHQDYGFAVKGLTFAGKPLTVGTTRYSRGVGTHAKSSWTIELNKNAVAFEAIVGPVDGIDARSTVIYRVIVDGKLAAQSKVISAQSRPDVLRADLRGATSMRLDVTDANDGNAFDTAQWIEPKVLLIDPSRRPNSVSPYVVPPPQDMALANLKPIKFRAVVVAAADDDGKNGRSETPEDMMKKFDQLNEIYSCVNVKFEFDPAKDFIRRNDTRINQKFDPRGVDVTNPDKEPPQAKLADHELARFNLQNEFPDAIVFVLMRDFLWIFDKEQKVWKTRPADGGYASAASVIKISTDNLGVYAHELGHFFALPHTHLDSTPKTITSVKALEAHFSRSLNETGSFERAVKELDDGIADTPPDPFGHVFGEVGRIPFVDNGSYEFQAQKADGTRVPFQIAPQFYNWMGYYEFSTIHPVTRKFEGRFTPLQCKRIRSFAEARAKSRDFLPWRPFFEAIQSDNLEQAEPLWNGLKVKFKDPEWNHYLQIANSWLEKPKFRSPASIPDSERTFGLHNASLVSSAVGWDRLERNRMPLLRGRLPFLVVDGKLFDHGFFAHAPSELTFELDGKWTQLSVTCGVIDGFPGTVKFRVLGDGKELGSADTLSSKKTHEFLLSVKGVRQLTLVADNGGDGQAGDFAMWGNPVLTR